MSSSGSVAAYIDKAAPIELNGEISTICEVLTADVIQQMLILCGIP